MPKSRTRHKHIGTRSRFCSGAFAIQSGLSRRNILLSAPPRKVSFESSRNDSSASICSDETIPTRNDRSTSTSQAIEIRPEKRSPIRKTSLLVRPITSLSLVDLAKSVACDDVSSVISKQGDQDEIERTSSSREGSLDLSPRTVLHIPDSPEMKQHQLCSSQESKSLRASPWGHFIDMATDDEDYYDNLSVSAYPYHGDLKTIRRKAPYSSCRESLCRTRRRSSPYGDYKTCTVETQPTLSFSGLRTRSKRRVNFRLSPRSKSSNQESADELIGFFSELQVQHF